MSDPINFDIETLVARYELHPNRQDVFVEGECDQGIIRAFLHDQGQRNVSVFSISVVNIPREAASAYFLPYPSSRSKVITLAKELEGHGISRRQVACIADSDLEQLLPNTPRSALLLLTDFTSMEMYVFSAEILNKVLTIVSPESKVTGTQLVKLFTVPLEFLFSARATSIDLKLNLEWSERIEKFLATCAGKIEFDEKEFLKRYVVIRVSKEILEQFNARLKQILATSFPDIRFKIRGHDFIKLLTWYLKKSEKCTHLNEDSVRQLLYVNVRAEELANHSMFSTLLTRIQS